MIRHVLTYAKSLNFSKIYIVSGEIGLYEKYGFKLIDNKLDSFGNKEQIFCITQNV